jgi:glycerophosphoryl diester phosphodiesterase
MENRQLVVMAHRGGGGLWPENTMTAFRGAVELGVDALELDIHSTRDGVLVVMHDDEVSRLTDGQGLIHTFSLEELQQLDAGYTWTQDAGQTYPFRGQGITVPTLEEVLDAFPGMFVNIDIKQAEPSIVEPFCDLLRRFNALERVRVGSFHDQELAKFRRALPQVPTAAGVSEVRLFYAFNRARLSWLYRPRAESFQIPETVGALRLVTPQFIRALHAQRREIHIWTVNQMTDMERLIEWGVDGLITDYPDRLLALLGR